MRRKNKQAERSSTQGPRNEYEAPFEEALKMPAEARVVAERAAEDRGSYKTEVKKGRENHTQR